MRLFVAIVVCLALLAAMFAVARGDAAAGIQYDEISRFIMPGATPPPPGAFATDLALVHDGKIVSENPMISQMPVMPAMPKLTPFSFLGAIFNPLGTLLGMGTQALMGGIMGGMEKGMLSKYRHYESGQLQHVAYDGTMGRAENRATGHVLITDTVKLRQYDLDPTTQSYRVENFSGAQNPPVPQTTSGGGTASVTVDIRTTKSAGMAFEGVDTDLYEIVEDVTVSKPTGTCKPMHMRFDTLQYVAENLAAPAGTSATLDQVMRAHPELAAGPNCTATTAVHTDNVAVPADRLILYSRMTMSMPDVQAQLKAESAKAQTQGQKLPSWMTSGSVNFTTVTERGNVRPLTQADSGALFSVPPGFTLRP